MNKWAIITYLNRLSGARAYFVVRDRAPAIYQRYLGVVRMRQPPYTPTPNSVPRYPMPKALEAWCNRNGGTRLWWKGVRGWWKASNGLELRALSLGKWEVIRPGKGRMVFYVRRGERGVCPAVRMEGGLEGWAWVHPSGRWGQFFRTKEGAERFRVEALL